MSRLAQRDVDAVACIAHELDTVRLGDPQILRIVMPELRTLLDIEISVAISVRRAPDGLRVAWSVGDRWSPSLSRMYRDYVAGMPTAYFRGEQPKAESASASRIWTDRLASYDATHPDPAQRNRAVDSVSLVTPDEFEAHSSMAQVWRPAGLHAHRQPRVLVCEGPSVLAWVGGFHPEVTRRHLGVLNALVPAFRRRLLFDRRVHDTERATAALEVALERIATPAFVVDRHGAVHETNAAGAQLLRTHNASVRASLTDATAGRAPAIAVELVPLRSPGTPRYWLALLHADAADTRALPQLALAAARWRLTPRECEVATWIVRGATNQRIATELGCAESTVESHITRILAKADLESRAQLIAVVLSA